MQRSYVFETFKITRTESGTVTLGVCETMFEKDKSSDSM